MIDPVLILKEGMENDAEAGDPILKVLQGRGLGVLEAFIIWIDMTQQAETHYYTALNQGASVKFALTVLHEKKEEFAALLEREIT
jgi:hypothetical protein